MLTTSSIGQCPASDSLWKRFFFIYNASSFSDAEKLHTLLSEEVKIKNCSETNDSAGALLQRMIGILYFNQADYLKSLQHCRQSIDIIVSNTGKSSINPKHLISNYYWLSVFYDSLDNIAEKQKALDSCVNVAMRLNSVDIYCIRALYARVEYLFAVGDYFRAIYYAKNCETFAREYANTGTKNEYLLGTSIATGSQNYEVNAQLQLKNYEIAEKLLANKIEECKKAGLKNYLGTLYAQLAVVQLKKENSEKALLYFNRAFIYEKEAGNNINCKVMLNDIGYNIYFKHFNDLDKALFYYRKALTFIDKEKSPKNQDAFETIPVLTNIANIYVQKGLFDSAFYYFQSAFDQIKPGITESELLNNWRNEFARIKNYYLPDLLMDKGNAFRKKYETTKEMNELLKAIRVYKTTDQLLDKIKTEQFDLNSKLFWRSDSHRLYEEAIDACYASNNTDDAFYFFEKSRAALLNDQLKEQRWLGEREIMKQTQVRKKLVELERELVNTDANSKHYTEIQEELLTQSQEQDRLAQSIKIANPLYYQSFLDNSPIVLQDVQKIILKDHQALVEVFSGDSAMYILIITTKDAHLIKTDKADFESISKEYSSYLSNGRFVEQELQWFYSGCT